MIVKNNFTVKRVVATRTDQTTDLTACGNEIITLDDSESDDASSLCGKPKHAETENVTPKESEEMVIVQSSDDEPDIVSLDGYDSDNSMPFGNGESTSEALVEKADPENDPTPTASTSEFDKESTSIGTQMDEFPADESDSDYSLPSLYSECMRKEDKPTFYTCPVWDCNTTNVKRHVQAKHPSRFQCPYCDYQPLNLTHHIQSKHRKVYEEYSIFCSHCLKKFAQEECLKRHVKACHDTRPINFTCEECGKGFVTKAGHASHMRFSHGRRGAEYECQECYKKFTSVFAYKEHIKTHSPTATKCEDCGKLFKNMLMLGKHKLKGYCEKRTSTSK